MDAIATLDRTPEVRRTTRSAPSVVGVARVGSNSATKTRAQEDFGAYFSGLMDGRGLSNVQLAKLSGVENGSISRWRRNVDDPSPAGLRKVAPHLGVRYGDLLIAADLATPEELGVSGSPPPPGGPLPVVLRRVVALLLDPRIRERDKLSLLKIIDKSVEMWEEMLDPRKTGH